MSGRPPWQNTWQEKQPPSQGWKTFFCQSRRRPRVDGDLFRSPDPPRSSFRPVVCPSDPAAFPAASLCGWVYRTPRSAHWILPPTDRSPTLANRPPNVYRSRFRDCFLWRCRHPATSSHGHTGSTESSPRFRHGKTDTRELIGSIRTGLSSTHVVVFGKRSIFGHRLNSLIKNSTMRLVPPTYRCQDAPDPAVSVQTVGSPRWRAPVTWWTHTIIFRA